MLDDRDYMRQASQPENRRQTGLACLFALIAINVLAFLLTLSPNESAHEHLFLNMENFEGGMFWQPLTAMFMHADFQHILFNMWGLYIFGGIVAPRLGGGAFLALYLTTGLLGNFLWMASELLFPPEYSAYLCGASGAVMGITAAAALLAPETRMLMLFIPFPIKLRTLAIVFLVLELLLQFTGTQQHVAHMAHIGGLVAGYVFLKIFFRREIRWDPLAALAGQRGYRSPRNNGAAMPGWTYHCTPDRGNDYGSSFSSDSNFGFNGTRVSQRELDYLLDKISRTGINSLTEQEIQRLKQARDQMRQS